MIEMSPIHQTGSLWGPTILFHNSLLIPRRQKREVQHSTKISMTIHD